MMPQQYCLRWKYHHSNLQNMFSQLLDRGCFCDVTLACEGQTIKAHRVVLCACSTYFDSILTNCSIEKDPIIIMKDCKFADVKCLIEFMYKGEINVEHNNLSSLLKTAEELRIKGLAEVSWRDDDSGGGSGGQNNDEIEQKSTNINSTYHYNNHTSGSNNNNDDITIPSGTHNATTLIKNIPLPLLASPKHHRLENGSPVPAHLLSVPVKKKRGRPPLDQEYDSYSTPKIAHVECNIPPFINAVTVMLDESSQDHHLNAKLNESGSSGGVGGADDNDDRSPKRVRDGNGTDGDEQTWDENNMEMHMDYEEEIHASQLIPKIERPDTPKSPSGDGYFENDRQSPLDDKTMSIYLTPQEQEEWKDVIKMDAYLTKGRRPQFWEEPFTRRVMEAIKTKDLEMKKAAQLLGVSYGTLYGRYRETYGCLKHPSRFRDFWTEQGPTEIIGMLQRGTISLAQAAELMNTSSTSLQGLLEQAQEWTVERDVTNKTIDNREDDPNKNSARSNNHPETSIVTAADLSITKTIKLSPKS